MGVGAGTGQGRLLVGAVVLLTRGSWAERLALQVNPLTWWLWWLLGGRGSSRSSEKLPEPGHRACHHPAEEGDRLGPGREQDYLLSSSPLTRGTSLVGNCIRAPQPSPRGASRGHRVGWGG